MLENHLVLLEILIGVPQILNTVRESVLQHKRGDVDFQVPPIVGSEPGAPKR